MTLGYCHSNGPSFSSPSPGIPGEGTRGSSRSTRGTSMVRFCGRSLGAVFGAAVAAGAVPWLGFGQLFVAPARGGFAFAADDQADRNLVVRQQVTQAVDEKPLVLLVHVRRV